MSLKNDIVNAVDSAKDSIDEARHRGTAEAEHDKREIAGDAMTPGEKVGSAANEAKNNVQAGIDRAKQDARNTP